MSHQLHLITDGAQTDDLLHRIEAAVAAGVHWVQVRAKAAPAADLYALARAVGNICARYGAGLIVNDRLDVAVAAGAQGVHLARKSLPVAAARRSAPPGFLVGASVHSVEAAVAAARDGADYVTFGSVYPTRSHPGAPGQGPAVLAQVVQAVDIPVLAIGGIGTDNVGPVLAAGVAGVALISAILQAPDVGAAARQMQRSLDDAGARPRVPFPALRAATQQGRLSDADSSER